jgi:hypothetical protein
MKSISLYVDDLRDCPNGFVVARTVDEAIYFLTHYEVDVMSLDHDLGEDADGSLMPSGYDLVKYMGEHRLTARTIHIHTDNPVGRENMYCSLLSFKRHALIPSDTSVYRHGIAPNRYSYYKEDVKEMMRSIMEACKISGMEPYVARKYETEIVRMLTEPQGNIHTLEEFVHMIQYKEKVES